MLKFKLRRDTQKMNYFIKIKGTDIPLSITNYKTAKSIKMYFKDGVLKITKSPYTPKIYVDKLLQQNEDKIYSEYKKILQQKEEKDKRWETRKKYFI